MVCLKTKNNNYYSCTAKVCTGEIFQQNSWHILQMKKRCITLKFSITAELGWYTHQFITHLPRAFAYEFHYWMTVERCQVVDFEWKRWKKSVHSKIHCHMCICSKQRRHFSTFTVCFTPKWKCPRRLHEMKREISSYRSNESSRRYDVKIQFSIDCHSTRHVRHIFSINIQLASICWAAVFVYHFTRFHRSQPITCMSVMPMSHSLKWKILYLSDLSFLGLLFFRLPAITLLHDFFWPQSLCIKRATAAAAAVVTETNCLHRINTYIKCH